MACHQGFDWESSVCAELVLLCEDNLIIRDRKRTLMMITMIEKHEVRPLALLCMGKISVLR